MGSSCPTAARSPSYNVAPSQLLYVMHILGEVFVRVLGGGGVFRQQRCPLCLEGVRDEAGATVVTSLPGGTVYGFPHVELWSYPDTFTETVAPGITWIGGGQIGAFYGTFNDGLPAEVVATGNGFGPGAMTFAFDTPVEGVGGFSTGVRAAGLA